VKAAFLYNFAKFVEWPPGTFANSNDPITICIVGQNPFGFHAGGHGAGQEDRRPRFRRAAASGHATGEQVPDSVYRAAESKRIRVWLEALKGAILTVGETRRFHCRRRDS